MKRIIVPTIITSLIAAAGCGGIEPSTAGSESPSYLFNLSAEQIEQVALHYDETADVARVLEQMKAPFACERFGSLCEQVGATRALALLEATWQQALTLAPRATIEAQLDARLPQARTAYADEHAALPAQVDGEQISQVKQASRPYPAGLSCPFGSIANESNASHRIAGNASIAHLGIISVGTIEISHYIKLWSFWLKWPTSAPLCITYNHSKVWDGTTTTSSNQANICTTGGDTVTRTHYWWRPAGQYFRLSGCGDYNNTTLKDCVCAGSYVGPYSGYTLLTATL